MIHNIHLRAPGNWINDPNGFIYYKGQYHLFYQYFPYGPRWGTMHWGHAISKDMVSWEHLGIAVFPSKDYDRNGVFSGSAIEKDGKLQLYYTSIVYENCNPDDIHLLGDGKLISSQSMIVSEDGIHFDNWNNKRQIIPVCCDDSIGDSADMRDPKVWFEDDHYTLILGSTYKSREGRLIFYRSSDSINWSFQNMIQDSRLGIILECPDLFSLNDNDYFLIGSPIAILDLEGVDKNQAIIRKVDYNPNNSQIDLGDDYQFIDYGFELYAPQSNLDADGRRVMFGWMRMPAPVEDNVPWNGMMTIPRVVEYKNNHVYFSAHPNIRAAFHKQVNVIDFCKNQYRIVSELKTNESLTVGGYRISYNGRYIECDRSTVMGKYVDMAMIFKTPVIDAEHCKLEVFVEKNLVEVFINDGEYVISNVVYDLKNEIQGVIDLIEEYDY